MKQIFKIEFTDNTKLFAYDTKGGITFSTVGIGGNRQIKEAIENKTNNPIALLEGVKGIIPIIKDGVKEFIIGEGVKPFLSEG